MSNLLTFTANFARKGLQNLRTDEAHPSRDAR